MLTLQERYRQEITGSLMKELEISNVFRVPRLVKVVLNMSSGDVAHDSKKLVLMKEELELIAGQKSVVTKAKKSIAGFKLREGMPLGVMVTLRGWHMYSFMDRLIHIALPRVRDFRGFSPKAFDGHGNYSLGIKEQTIFPEINYDKIDKIRGLDITICTSTPHDREAYALLKAMQFPFRGENPWQK